MTTNYHTAIPSAPKQAANASTLNAPLAELDEAIGLANAKISASLDTDGTLKAGAVDTAAALADGVVETAKLDDEAVTVAKLDADIIGAFTPGSDQTLKAVSDKTPIDGPDANNVDAEESTTDTDDLEALSVTGAGDVRVAGTTHVAPPVNNIGTDALTDARGRVVLGVGDRGALRGDFRPGYLGADINHILITGQSLAVGDWGGPALSTTQPYGNVGFIGGGSDDMSEFVPLTEPAYRDVILQAGSSGDAESTVETIASGMANLVSALVYDMTAAREYHRSLVSIHGEGASDYDVIKRGGSGDAYALGMQQVSAARDLAAAKNLSYRVAAVCLVHGEADRNNTDYDDDITQLQRDYENDIFAITGQHDNVPLLFCQTSSWTSYSQTTAVGPLLQVTAAKNNPGRCFLVGPKYFLPYSDSKHLTNIGYRWLGEYYAKVYRRVVVERKAWWPVMPAYAWRDGADIYVHFHVPVAPLQFDTTNVSNPGNYGFEYSDASSSASISSVSIVNETTVKITLNTTPTGATKRIAYARTGTSGADAGPTTGPRGNLCDSDSTRSLYGNNLRNWCVTFSEDLT